MNTKPIVSVVMPMYNVQAYVAQAIESVLAQSFSNFELICVDDGCTDDTLQIVNSFTDNRVRIVKQANRGLAGARNTGIALAKGQFIALLDSDDFWHSDKLGLHVAHLQNDPELGVSYSASEFVDEQGQLLGIGQHPKLTHISASDIFCRNPVGNGSAPVFRASALASIAKVINKRWYYFDEKLRQSEDIELWVRMILQGDIKFEGLAQGLTFYRVNDGGLSANIDKQLASWEAAVQGNRENFPEFFDQYYGLALAYQKRYLARRAVRSRDGKVAIKLMNAALYCDIRILTQEPKRTLVSYAAAVLSIMPRRLYEPLEKAALRLSASH